MARTAKVQVFEGRDGQWYWRRRAANGQITDASEGYTRRASARRGAERAHPGTPLAELA